MRCGSSLTQLRSLEARIVVERVYESGLSDYLQVVRTSELDLLALSVFGGEYTRTSLGKPDTTTELFIYV